MDFYATQELSGHGSFISYLCRIGGWEKPGAGTMRQMMTQRYMFCCSASPPIGVSANSADARRRTRAMKLFDALTSEAKDTYDLIMGFFSTVMRKRFATMVRRSHPKSHSSERARRVLVSMNHAGEKH